jgi:predicted RNA-binding protein
VCQTVVYVIKEGKEVPVLGDVVRVSPEGGNVRMVDLFGEERVIPGRIIRIDLLTHRIIIQADSTQ